MIHIDKYDNGKLMICNLKIASLVSIKPLCFSGYTVVLLDFKYENKS